VVQVGAEIVVHGARGQRRGTGRDPGGRGWVLARTRCPERSPGTQPPPRPDRPLLRDPCPAASSETPSSPAVYPAVDTPHGDQHDPADGEKGKAAEDRQGGRAPPPCRGFLSLLKSDRGGQDQPEDDPEDQPTPADPVSRCRLALRDRTDRHTPARQRGAVNQWLVAVLVIAACSGNPRGPGRRVTVLPEYIGRGHGVEHR